MGEGQFQIQQINEERRQKELAGSCAEKAQDVQVKHRKQFELESGLCTCLTTLDTLEALRRQLQPRLSQQLAARSTHIQDVGDAVWAPEQRSILMQGLSGFWDRAVSFLLVVDGPQGCWLRRIYVAGGVIIRTSRQ